MELLDKVRAQSVNHQQNFNPVNGANKQMIERAWRCACLKIIKNVNNVHPASFPGYLAELWWVQCTEQHCLTTL